MRSRPFRKCARTPWPPNGSGEVLVAAGTRSESLPTVLDLSTGRIIDHAMQPSPVSNSSVCFSPRGDRVAFAAGRGRGSVGIVERDLARAATSSEWLQEVPENRAVLLDLSSGKLRVFLDIDGLAWKEGATGAMFGPLRPHAERNAFGGKWSQLAFSRDGTRCALLNFHGEPSIEVYDLERAKPLASIKPIADSGGVNRWSNPLRFGPDGTRVALLGDSRLEVWNVEDGQSVAVVPTDAAAFAFRDADGPGRSVWLVNAEESLAWTLGETKTDERGRLREREPRPLATRHG